LLEQPLLVALPSLLENPSLALVLSQLPFVREMPSWALAQSAHHRCRVQNPKAVTGLRWAIVVPPAVVGCTLKQLMLQWQLPHMLL
jgi:hypothetical protein